MTTTTAVTYRVLGTTDDVTECGICGKVELKGTIALDSDGVTIYAGFTCGAKLAGRPVRDIRSDAQRADEAKREAARAARDEALRVETAAFMAWVLQTYGVEGKCAADLWNKVPGFTPFALLKAFEAAA